jgi:hypothetical protein
MYGCTELGGAVHDVLPLQLNWSEHCGACSLCGRAREACYEDLQLIIQSQLHYFIESSEVDNCDIS